MKDMSRIKDMPIAVLGGGASGRTQAADCALAGKSVRMFEFEEFASSLGIILEEKKIEIIGEEANLYGFKRNGIAQIDVVTTNMKEAVAGAGLIVISLPAVAFERLFDLLIPCLEDGQVIHFMTGNFGSLMLRKKMREADCNKDIIIGEWSSQPYGTRVKMSAKVQRPEVTVHYRAITLRGSALPSNDTDAFFKSVKYLPSMDAVKHLEAGTSVVDIGFSNVNPVLHLPGTLLGVSTMENIGKIFGNDRYEFSIYSHSFCPSISEVQFAFYSEQCAVAEAMGTTIIPFKKKDFFSRSNLLGQEFMGPDMALPFDEQFDIMKYTGPFDIHNRYVTEDIPVGCCIQKAFAEKYGIKTPIIDSMIALATVMTQNDYTKLGWTLEMLGIDHLNKDELLNYLHTGEIG